MNKNDIYLYKLKKYENKLKLHPDYELYKKKIKLYKILLSGGAEGKYQLIPDEGRKDYYQENKDKIDIFFPENYRYEYPIINFNNKTIELNKIKNIKIFTNSFFNKITKGEINIKLSELEKLLNFYNSKLKDEIEKINNNANTEFDNIKNKNININIGGIKKNIKLMIQKFSQNKLEGIMKYFLVTDLILNDICKEKQGKKNEKESNIDKLCKVKDSYKDSFLKNIIKILTEELTNTQNYVKYFLYDYIIDNTKEKKNFIENVVIKQFITYLGAFLLKLTQPEDIDVDKLYEFDKLLILKSYVITNTMLNHIRYLQLSANKKYSNIKETINDIIEKMTRYQLLENTPSEDCYFIYMDSQGFRLNGNLQYFDHSEWYETIFINGINKPKKDIEILSDLMICQNKHCGKECDKQNSNCSKKRRVCSCKKCTIYNGDFCKTFTSTVNPPTSIVVVDSIDAKPETIKFKPQLVTNDKYLHKMYYELYYNFLSRYFESDIEKNFNKTTVSIENKIMNVDENENNYKIVIKE